MSKQIKKVIAKTPLVGRVAKVAKRVYSLPDYQINQEAVLSKTQAELAASIEQLSSDTKELSAQFRAIQNVQDDIQKQLLVIGKYSSSKNDSPSKNKSNQDDLFADDHALDVFYASFEDRFRGPEAEIEKRLEVYLPYFANSKVNFTKNPVLDIGCGRGEFLRMLGKSKINATGLDINLDMVNRASQQGLKAQQGDALSFLGAADSRSLGVISGFHIAEHIPFPVLYRIFKEAHRVLANDGFVIFETPNPENLTVSGHTFYMDPSHLHPLPPALLQFTLEACGFVNVEIKRLHPAEQPKGSDLPKAVKDGFFGARDYAVIGYK
ncbi:MAG: class I SAM-dependent methyltransferase [Candidatus Saccharimonadales bacterium]